MSMKATKFSVAYILGYLMNFPDILRDSQYKFDIRDFPSSLTQVIYMAINNCAQGGCNKITPKELLASIENSAKATKIFNDASGNSYINDCYKLGKEDNWENFEYHYNLLKKQSLLLSLKSQGFNISEIWSENPLSTELDEKQTANLEKLTIEDIINYFEHKLDVQRNFYTEGQGQISVKANEGMKELVESLKETPEMGAPINSNILNTIYRGARLGKLYMRSASSGCVDCDTEYFNGTEWKKISEYQRGEKVLQYHVDTGKADLTYPLRYIKAPCSEMYKMNFNRNINMMLSEEHNMLLFNKNNKPLQYTAKKFVEKFNNRKYGLAEMKILNSFSFNGKGINLSDFEIRLMIAIFADGSFYSVPGHDPLYCCFNLKKERKKQRLEWLLQQCNITYKKTISSVQGFHKYSFYAPMREKHFPKEWYQCTQKQFEIICDEVLYWDTYISKTTPIYCTTSKEDADFIQFVSSSLGKRATITECDRTTQKRKNSKYPYKNKEYYVFLGEKSSSNCGCSNSQPIIKIPTKDGYKYCFETPQHTLILRRNNKIFVSYNSGKTRLMLADACKTSVPYIYDIAEQKWLVNDFSAPTLFITTELEIEEVQTMLLAYVSGVDETHILDGRYEDDEELRIEKAIGAVSASPLYIEQVPNFNMEDIERVIRKHKTTNNIQYVFFDYVFISGKMIIEMAQKSRGIKIREDNVLYLFLEKMKFLCNKYKIHISTASQLNGDWKNVKTADETILRGAKAMADKLDCGSIVMKVTEMDKQMLAPILEQHYYQVPNLVYNIYKVRRGKYNKIKLWIYFDYATLRTTDLFVTTNDYELIPIVSTNLDQIVEKYSTKDFPLTCTDLGVQQNTSNENEEENESEDDNEDTDENITNTNEGEGGELIW